MSHGQDYQCKEDRQSDREIHYIGGPPYYCPGNRGFNCGDRTKPAKIKRGVWAEEVRDKDQKAHKYAVLDKPRPRRNLKLDIRHLVKKFLSESERAGPTAQEPSRQKSGHSYPANYAQWNDP